MKRVGDAGHTQYQAGYSAGARDYMICAARQQTGYQRSESVRRARFLHRCYMTYKFVAKVQKELL